MTEEHLGDLRIRGPRRRARDRAKHRFDDEDHVWTEIPLSAPFGSTTVMPRRPSVDEDARDHLDASVCRSRYSLAASHAAKPRSRRRSADGRSVWIEPTAAQYTSTPTEMVDHPCIKHRSPRMTLVYAWP